MLVIAIMGIQMNATKKKVLIVDDEEDLTWSISRKLTRDTDMLEVLCANSGNTALDMLTKQRFDLLVTDLRMPGISGIELLNEVKRHYPETHVIIMTAHGSLDIKKEINSFGRTGYIEKPFDMNDLRDLIYEYLDGKPQFVLPHDPIERQ